MNSEQLTLSAAGSREDPAKIPLAQERARALLASARACGISSLVSSASWHRDGSSSRTLPAGVRAGSMKWCVIWSNAAMSAYRSRCRRAMSALGNDATERSSWPALTRKANLLAPSMQKWAAHRRMLPTLRRSDESGNGRGNGRHKSVWHLLPIGQVGGSLNPTWCEWFMGAPDGWTRIDPSVRVALRSEMAAFRNAQRSSDG